MKKKMRKFLLTLSAALLLVTMTVGVTVAYLTDEDAVTNTFTVGQVGIELDEKNNEEEATNPITDCTNENHNHEGRDRENEYYLYPGESYEKDPTIWFDEDCKRAYLRVVIEFENGAPVEDAERMALAEIFTSSEDNDWNWQNGKAWEGIDSPKTVYEEVEVVDENGDTQTKEVAKDIIYTLTFKDYIAADTPELPLFEKMVVAEELTNDDLLLLNELKVKISAYAVQADGFNSEDEAFNPASANKAFEDAFDQW